MSSTPLVPKNALLSPDCSFNDVLAYLVGRLDPSYVDAVHTISRHHDNLYAAWKTRSDNGQKFFLALGISGCTHRQYLDRLFWRGPDTVREVASMNDRDLEADIRSLSPVRSSHQNQYDGRILHSISWQDVGDFSL